jgi:hypothetical protein
MAQKYETQAAGADLGFDGRSKAWQLGSIENSDCPSVIQELIDGDPYPILRKHWGLDGPDEFRQIGNIAVDVLIASLDRRLARHAPVRLPDLVS